MTCFRVAAYVGTLLLVLSALSLLLLDDWLTVVGSFVELAVDTLARINFALQVGYFISQLFGYGVLQVLVADVAQKWLRAASELLEERAGDACTVVGEPEATAIFTGEGFFLAFLNVLAT